MKGQRALHKDRCSQHTPRGKLPKAHRREIGVANHAHSQSKGPHAEALQCLEELHVCGIWAMTCEHDVAALPSTRQRPLGLKHLLQSHDLHKHFHREAVQCLPQGLQNSSHENAPFRRASVEALAVLGQWQRRRSLQALAEELGHGRAPQACLCCKAYALSCKVTDSAGSFGRHDAICCCQDLKGAHGGTLQCGDAAGRGSPRKLRGVRARTLHHGLHCECCCRVAAHGFGRWRKPSRDSAA
mmetsp:Transcript_121791/g.221524  ORF Transcript_121791/g.221524 Transcript_121791/m.221524 type:complete len:242 (+) Transcript_121791:1118-1843(+)